MLGVTAVTTTNPTQLTFTAAATVPAGAVAIPFLETDTQGTFGTDTQNAVNAANAGSNNIVASFVRDRISFLNASPITSSFTGSPLTNIPGVSTVTPGSGNIAVNFSFGDSIPQVAQDMATAINTYNSGNPAFGVSANASGGEVTLTGETGTTHVDSPLTLQNGLGGGEITGMAFIGNHLYAVTDQGSLFEINNYSGVSGASLTFIGNVNSQSLPFSGLTAGPPDVNGGAYANDLFATTSGGTVYAFDTNGVLQNVFTVGGVPASSISSGAGSANGLAFSTLDYNLWHVTTDQRRSGARHQCRAGRVANGDHRRRHQPVLRARPPVPAGSPGFINANTPVGSTVNQPGAANYASNPALYNTYNLPGGAMGDILPIRSACRGIGPARADAVLHLPGQHAYAGRNFGAAVTDTLRVYAVVKDPTTGQITSTVELATNNQTLSKPALPGTTPTAELPAYATSQGERT